MRMKTMCARCFKNLGVDSRVKIYFYLLENQNLSVSELVSRIGLRQPTVSYHLLEMTKSGLLNRKSEGKNVLYSVNPDCPHDGTKCVINSPVNNNVSN